MSQPNPPIAIPLPKNPPHQSSARTIAWIIIIILSLGLFGPWTGAIAPDDVDLSWYVTLHWAFVHGLQYGKDILFTYGPWGFVACGYDPATFAWSVAAWTLLTLALVVGLWRLAWHFSPNPALAGAWLAAVLIIARVQLPFIPDTRIFALIWILFLIHFYVADGKTNWTDWILIAAIALASLIKFSWAIMAGLAIAAIALDDLRQRKIPRLPIGYVALCLAFWILAGQNPLNIPAYLTTSFDIASGYAGALGIWIPHEMSAIIWLATATILLLMSLYARKRPIFLILPAMVFMIWILFKAGFVRRDEVHEASTTAGMAILSLLCLAAVWPMMRSRIGRASSIAALVISIGLGIYSYCHDTGHRLTPFAENSITQLPDDMLQFVRCLVGDSNLDKDLDSRMNRLRDQPFPRVTGSVDVYPWGQANLLARPVDFRPRPVSASYFAATTKLQQLNADFLLTPRAPESLAVEFVGPEGTYPAQEDSLSWPKFLTLYQPGEIRGDWLLLQRSAALRTYSIQQIVQGATSMRVPVPVPESNDPIWVSIDLHPTLSGKLLKLFYKPRLLRLVLRTQDGTTHGYRLLPDVAASGFLLSPRIDNPNSFAALYSPDWPQRLAPLRVTQLAVGMEDPADPTFEHEYTLTFSRLHISAPTP